MGDGGGGLVSKWVCDSAPAMMNMLTTYETMATIERVTHDWRDLERRNDGGGPSCR